MNEISPVEFFDSQIPLNAAETKAEMSLAV